MASYDTVENANTYFSNRLYALTWSNSSDSEKTIALAEASQRIDLLRFKGNKVESTQDLAFPRYYGDDPDGTETIPDDIKIACFEVAMALLDGVDPEVEIDNLNLRSQAFSSVKTSYLGILSPEHFAAGIPSAFAWMYLRPYLVAGDSVKLRRTT